MACVTSTTRWLGGVGCFQPAGRSAASTMPVSARKRAVTSLATDDRRGAPVLAGLDQQRVLRALGIAEAAIVAHAHAGGMARVAHDVDRRADLLRERHALVERAATASAARNRRAWNGGRAGGRRARRTASAPGRACVSTVVAGWSSRPQTRLKSSSTMRDLNGVRGSKRVIGVDVVEGQDQRALARLQPPLPAAHRPRWRPTPRCRGSAPPPSRSAPACRFPAHGCRARRPSPSAQVGEGELDRRVIGHVSDHRQVAPFLRMLVYPGTRRSQWRAAGIAGSSSSCCSRSPS